MANEEASSATPAKKTTAKAATPKKAAPKKATAAKGTPAKKAVAKKATAKKAPGRPGKGKPEFGQELTARERRCVMLSALGYTDAKLAKELGPPFGIISTSTATNEILSAGVKLGLGRHGLVIWAMNQLEGEARERQVRAAERRRAQLRVSGVMTPARVQVAMLYADPEHCDKSQTEIGAMITPTPISSTAVSNHVRTMATNIGANGSLTKLIAVMTLAPFSDRQTGDVAEEPETL